MPRSQNKPKARRVGRPKGSGPGRTTKGYKITVPLDLAPWLDQQQNKSAIIAAALRAHIRALFLAGDLRLDEYERCAPIADQ